MAKLIVLEGTDGSGKATQAAALVERLKAMGRKSRLLSFPCYNAASSALVRMYLDGAFGDKPEDVGPYAASTFYAVDCVRDGHMRSIGQLLTTEEVSL